MPSLTAGLRPPAGGSRARAGPWRLFKLEPRPPVTGSRHPGRSSHGHSSSGLPVSAAPPVTVTRDSAARARAGPAGPGQPRPPGESDGIQADRLGVFCAIRSSYGSGPVAPGPD